MSKWRNPRFSNRSEIFHINHLIKENVVLQKNFKMLVIIKNVIHVPTASPNTEFISHF